MLEILVGTRSEAVERDAEALDTQSGHGRVGGGR